MDKGRSSKVNWSLVGLGVMLVLAIALGTAIENGRPRSSQGVERLGDTAARITADDTLVLKQRKSKYWVITFNGDSTVHFKQDTELLPDEHTFTLCGVDCEVDTGLGFFGHVTLIERNDGSVDVDWPSGDVWRFR